jgi:hypothetical protein
MYVSGLLHVCTKLVIAYQSISPITLRIKEQDYLGDLVILQEYLDKVCVYKKLHLVLCLPFEDKKTKTYD